MNTLKFKTNINCNNCITAVTPYFNNADKISEWNVDITDPKKILTVTGEEITPDYITEIAGKAGYKAEQIN
jgi:copper chaperone